MGGDLVPLAALLVQEEPGPRKSNPRNGFRQMQKTPIEAAPCLH